MTESLVPGLDPILRQAASQSPRMINRAIDLEIAENDRIQARAGLLPSVGGTYRDYQARDDRADLNDRVKVRKVYYDFSINQPLFYWGERRNGARMGEIREKIAQGQYRDGYRLLAQDLRARYLSLTTQKTALERARFNQKFTAEQLRIAEDKRAKNVISDLELFGPRLTAERAQIDLERAEFDYGTALQAFGRLAGMPSFGDDSVPDAVPKAAYDADSCARLLASFLALKEYPTAEAATARHQLEIAQLDTLNQKTRQRPKLSFSAGANQDEQSYTINAAQKYRVNSYYAGIQASWNIFDGFISQAALRTSLARRRQLENDYAELANRLAIQAQSQHKQIYFAARSMSITDRFLESAEGNLQSKRDEFKRGLISEADLSAAQLWLLDARINAYNARADYLMRIGDFLGTIGRDPALTNVNITK